MNTLQSSLVQFCYYGAYFCLAIPAALINKRFSYKTGVLTGLGCASIGAFMFYPASQSMTYGFFLAALFILAAGLSILETSANPYVIAMGPTSNSARRLNLAQAFNPVGTNIGVFMAATLILPNLHHATGEERAMMNAKELSLIQSNELAAVMTPYVGMACALVLIWLAIAFFTPSAKSTVSTIKNNIDFKATIKRLLHNKHYSFGVIAQFFNVAAQTCVWTYTISYTMSAISTDEVGGGEILQYSMITFLIARFLMTWLMGFIRPAILLTLTSLLAVFLCLYMTLQPNITGVWALIAISACLSLMFPTIYAISLHGLKEDTKFGAAGLVMAILGGALMPMLQASIIDNYGIIISYLVPAICFCIVGAYAIFDLKSQDRV